MQFALPPRKPSHAPFPSRSSRSGFRRSQMKSCAIISCAVVSLLFFIFHILSSGSSPDIPAASGPNVVLVTVLDEQYLSEKYIQRIKENREDYVKRHGYVNFFASTAEYLPSLGNAPRSWSVVPAMRHAMTLHPDSVYFFHLSPHSVIMDPTLPLGAHILDQKKLDSLMIKDVPVVPPDSVIKTFSHLSAADVDLVITQDGENLSPGSFILKKGDWAKFFLDVWFDPLYRSYNFAKAEMHALDHIVQWHPTILAKLALIPQRMLNSYSPDSPQPGSNGVYKDGDFLVRMSACETTSKRDCEKELEPFWEKWSKNIQGRF